MGEKTLRIGTGVGDLVVSRAGHLALRLKSTRLAQRGEFNRGIFQRVSEQGGGDGEPASIYCDSFDQLTWWLLDLCAGRQFHFW